MPDLLLPLGCNESDRYLSKAKQQVTKPRPRRQKKNNVMHWLVTSDDPSTMLLEIVEVAKQLVTSSPDPDKES